jgi:hypothetical protein
MTQLQEVLLSKSEMIIIIRLLEQEARYSLTDGEKELLEKMKKEIRK